MLSFVTCLLGSNSHAIFDIGKHSWLHEITFITLSPTTAHQFGTFLLTAIDEFQNFSELLAVDLTEVRGW